MYNASEVRLRWEPKSPVAMGPDQHLTEYVLTNFFTNESMINADMRDLRHGAFGKFLFAILRGKKWNLTSK